MKGSRSLNCDSLSADRPCVASEACDQSMCEPPGCCLYGARSIAERAWVTTAWLALSRISIRAFSAKLSERHKSAITLLPQQHSPYVESALSTSSKQTPLQPSSRQWPHLPPTSPSHRSLTPTPTSTQQPSTMPHQPPPTPLNQAPISREPSSSA
jgi:hypothetical protein